MAQHISFLVLHLLESLWALITLLFINPNDCSFMLNNIYDMNIHHRKFWSKEVEVHIKVRISSHSLISLFKSDCL